MRFSVLFHCACAKSAIIQLPVKKGTSYLKPATPISCREVEIVASFRFSVVFGRFFTPHAQNPPYFYFRSKIEFHI